MSRIVAFHSLRGGSGVSTLAANLGWLAALSGQRVAVIDADLFQPALHFALGLGSAPEGRSLSDVVLDDAPLDGVVRDLGQGFEGMGGGALAFAGASASVDTMIRFAADGFSTGRLLDAIQTIGRQEQADLVLLDVPSGIRPESLLLLGIADEVVSVLRAEAQDFAATSAARALHERLGVPIARLMANRISGGIDATILGSKLSKAYGCPMLGSISEAPDLASCGGRQLFARAHPGHSFTRNLARVAKSLVLGEQTPAKRAAPLAPRVLSSEEREAEAVM